MTREQLMTKKSQSIIGERDPNEIERIRSASEIIEERARLSNLLPASCCWYEITKLTQSISGYIASKTMMTKKDFKDTCSQYYLHLLLFELYLSQTDGDIVFFDNLIKKPSDLDLEKVKADVNKSLERTRQILSVDMATIDRVREIHERMIIPQSTIQSDDDL